MTRTFISYRHTDAAQIERVRGFARQLRDSGVEIIFDEFYLEQNPAGPPEGWPQWCSDQASRAEKVLIIGNDGWFRCFTGDEQAGTGRGAACEAADLRMRIYNANNHNEHIRIAVFDPADAAQMPIKLQPYHHFQVERDFDAIVKWLGGTQPALSAAPAASIPHNLPSLQPFYGRSQELQVILDALKPQSRIWGVLIDGPGGMGKTSLAIRAAHAVPPQDFSRIIFISMKTRELDDDGVRDLGNDILTGLQELYNELARELRQPEIAMRAEDQRQRMLLDALFGTRTLLILDNLESLTKGDRSTIFAFARLLPAGCKAILTCRGRIGNGAEELILEKLDQKAALETLSELAAHNPTLARTSEAERIALYTQTGGKPLLLRWTAGQIGRGSSLTVADAIKHLRSCPKDNDSLEFIFSNLVDDFTADDVKVLAALACFTQPTKVKYIAELAGLKEMACLALLNSSVNRFLAVPSEDLDSFVLVPMVSDFLRTHLKEAVDLSAGKFKRKARTLIRTIGPNNSEGFLRLDKEWETLSPVLPHFLAGKNRELQEVCVALFDFLDSTGRWDELLSLSLKAEARALEAGDYLNAGWRACDVGWVHGLHYDAEGVMDWVMRADQHWRKARTGASEAAFVIRLRGLGHRLKKDYDLAMADAREALEISRHIASRSKEVADALNDLALAERASGKLDAADKHHIEALGIAEEIGDLENQAVAVSNRAEVAMLRKNWDSAEKLARDVLTLSLGLGRLEWIASNEHRLAYLLLRRGAPEEAWPLASSAVEKFTKLGSPKLAEALNTLRACEAALSLHPPCP